MRGPSSTPPATPSTSTPTGGLRPLGAFLLPAAVLLSLATVYCQFHYAVDALAGAALALAALFADRRAGYDSAPAGEDQ